MLGKIHYVRSDSRCTRIRTPSQPHTHAHTRIHIYNRVYIHVHTYRVHSNAGLEPHAREHTLSQLTQKEGEHYEDRLRCWRACCRVPVLHCSWMLSWNKNNESRISVWPGTSGSKRNTSQLRASLGFRSGKEDRIRSLLFLCIEISSFIGFFVLSRGLIYY